MKDSLRSSSLLQLLRIVSPALPVGAYAGSEGLEYAVEVGWVSNEEQTLEWIRGRLRHSLTHLDVPLLARFQAAWPGMTTFLQMLSSRSTYQVCQ